MGIAPTPVPPYYVAVITVERTASDEGYFEMANAMSELAQAQPGFLGMEWVYDAGQRTGITSSYWADPEAIAAAIERVHREGLSMRERTADWFARNRERLSIEHSLQTVLAS